MSGVIGLGVPTAAFPLSRASLASLARLLPFGGGGGGGFGGPFPPAPVETVVYNTECHCPCDPAG
jgi:hypothetical protein